MYYQYKYEDIYILITRCSHPSVDTQIQDGDRQHCEVPDKLADENASHTTSQIENMTQDSLKGKCLTRTFHYFF